MLAKDSFSDEGNKENDGNLIRKIQAELSDYFDQQQQSYLRHNTIYEAVKTIIKRIKLLYSILDKQRADYFEQYIRFRQFQRTRTIQGTNNQQQLSKQIRANIDKINQLELTLKNQTDQFQSFKLAKQQQIKQLSDKYQKTIQDLRQQLQKVQTPQQQQFQNIDVQKSIFMGEILLQQPDYISYLTEVLERTNKKKIKNTKFLYRWDPHNTANVHLYIDEHPNILLVIMTKSQHHIAAFSQDPFSPNSQPSKQGIIFSLTNFQNFKSVKRSIVYDAYHIIFGNSEIRIATGQNKLSSNFGVLNAYYEGTGRSINQLLGQGTKRTVQMEAYEILEVFFK